MGLPEPEQRFEELYMAHYPAIATYVRRRASPDDIADVIAETFTTAWRRLDDIPRREEEARLWLYGVARRVLANHFRAEEHRTALAARLREEAASWAVPDRTHDPAYQAFQRLSDDDRELLSLVAWEGLSGPEIAKVLFQNEKSLNLYGCPIV
ncbi:RNA polymerase sigma factor [Nonomuraea sp. NPDC049309]|uniref:RNA polymerase sigma factor n=1 Tax=Nonomuraea sp. NPDC049309 TaxID=3364350 RepID=UPI0037115EF8